MRTRTHKVENNKKRKWQKETSTFLVDFLWVYEVANLSETDAFHAGVAARNTYDLHARVRATDRSESPYIFLLTPLSSTFPYILTLTHFHSLSHDFSFTSSLIS